MSDTIDNKAAILVDHSLYARDRIKFNTWLRLRSFHMVPILLVTYPDLRDYDPTKPPPSTDPEWGAVIRNSGFKREVDFKRNALGILRDIANCTPIVAVDGNFEVRQMFNDEGLIILDERYFDIHG